jgi:DoxX-like family
MTTSSSGTASSVRTTPGLATSELATSELATFENAVSTAPVNRTHRLYIIAIGIFSVVFLGSAIFGLLDLDGSKAEWSHLKYPWWTFYLLTVGKILGVVAIVSNRSKSLKQLAFAGFLYDLVLAAGAHLAVPEIKVLLPIVVFGIWLFAYVMDKRRFPD